MASTVKRTDCTECGSSNNLCWFTTDSGHLTSKCMTPGCTGSKTINNQEQKELTKVTNNFNTNNDLILTGRYEDLTDRGISEETCRKYLVQVDELHGKKIHIYNYTNSKGDIISQKIRYVDQKDFIWRQNSNDKHLFGVHAIPEGTKELFICEGELDGLSLAQIGIPSISISTGAGDQTINEIKRHLEFLEQFERIVLVFDNDKVGQDTAKEVLKLFTPGKGYNVVLKDYKDPNDYIKNNAIEPLIAELNAAQQYIPVNIRVPTKESLKIPEQTGLLLPYKDLNKAIKGIKPGRIYTLLAGSGAGKSTFTKELLYSLLETNEDLNVGAVYLEEPINTTSLGFIALDNNIPVHELEEDPTQLNGKFDTSYDKFFNGRIQCVDASFMKLESKELVNTLNYLAVGLKCKIIVLDHLTMCTYDMQGEQSERKDIDMLMKALRELTYKTQCSIILVSHLKRPSMGRSWAEGREINMTDSRGSAAIEQLSDVILALERNMLDDAEKNKTKLKVLKNRVTGKTGYMEELYYDEKTGRLVTMAQLFK